MMSPLGQTLCCALALAAAGVPLLYFTTPAAAPPPAQPAPTTPAAPTPATLRCSGQPQLVRLWQGGELLCELHPSGGMWQGVLHLPAASFLELEVEATWPHSDACQAITIELSPSSLPPRQDTQWSSPSAPGDLHTIFTFSWL